MLVKCHECGAEVSASATACPKCGAPPRKKTGLLAWVLGVLVLLGVISTFVGKTPQESKPAGSDARGHAVGEKAAAILRDQVEACSSAIEAQKAEYAKLMAAGKQWEAAGAIRGCANLLGDAALKDMVAKAEQQGLIASVNNAKAPPGERVSALERLSRDYPEKAEPYLKMLPPLQAKADEALKAERKKQAAAEAARRKKEGVSIGMTKEEVLASSWGRPQSVNKTTYSFGVHEQWVYGDGNYLYFENGVLKTIQN